MLTHENSVNGAQSTARFGPGQPPPHKIYSIDLHWVFGTGKRGHYERGLFTGGISRISKVSRFSRISKKWSDSPLFSTVWGFSKIIRISKFSRKWTFLKRPLFQKTPFSEPEVFFKKERIHKVCFFWAFSQYLNEADKNLSKGKI